MGRIMGQVLGAIVAFLIVYLLLWPVDIEPVSWTSEPAPPLEGSYAPNELLQGMELFPTPDTHGPEDVAVDAMGRVYVGVHEGKILRYSPDGQDVEVFAETGGRPLGLDFDVDGNLIVADAFKGLLSIDADGAVEVLCTEAGYQPFRFTDDVDVDSKNVAWFSDASSKWSEGQVMNSALESAPNGRLVKYDIESGECEVVLDKLHFANGVAVSPDETYVLVNETMRYRTKKVYVRGPRAGQVDTFLDNLPGFPDGISTAPDGTFWLAIYAPRNALLDTVSEYPWLRKVIARIPSALQPKPERHPFILGVDRDGNVVHNLQDSRGERFSMTTSAEQAGETLYIGSLVEPAWGRIDISTLP